MLMWTVMLDEAMVHENNFRHSIKHLALQELPDSNSDLSEMVETLKEEPPKRRLSSEKRRTREDETRQVYDK